MHHIQHHIHDFSLVGGVADPKEHGEKCQCENVYKNERIGSDWAPPTSAGVKIKFI